MLRTNLSTRPFYNERLVKIVIAAVAVVALALAVYDGARIYVLSERRAALNAEADLAEQRARDFRAQGQGIRQELSSDEVGAVRAAAQEANALIEQRAFSWTELFNRFETTLPADVRVMAVRPQVDSQGRLLVMITTVSRRVEDVDEFIGRLEESGGFTAVLSRQEEVQDDGTLLSVIQGYYSSVGPAASSPEPAAEAR